jgi:hypothetical protein
MSTTNVFKKRIVGALLGLAAVAAWAPPIQAGVSPVAMDGPTQTAFACVPREQCCKVCSKGKACGNTCMRADYNCHKGPGCACDAEDVCETFR